MPIELLMICWGKRVQEKGIKQEGEGQMKEVGSKTKYSWAVWDITKRIQSMPSLEQALNYALELVADTIEVETGTLWYYDKAETGRIIPAFILNQTMPPTVTLLPGEGIAGAVIENGRSEVVLDCSTDPRWANRVDAESGFLTRNMICVPLLTSYETIGCIQLINKRNVNTFSLEDLELAEDLASLAAMAIDSQGLMLRMPQENNTIVALSNVSKEFGSGNNRVQVLKDISLEIYEHEFIVILGASGSGKTTLLNLIGGMEPATSGTVACAGYELTGIKQKKLTEYRRLQVGFVFQAYHLMPNLTAKENLALIADRTTEPMDAVQALDLVSMGDRADHYPSQLSGGQQQRVSIARALVKRPRLILADEPTAALDYHTSLEILEVFQQVVQKKLSTVILITHNPEIARMADRVLRISDGTLSEIIVNPHPAAARELRW